MLMPQVKSVLTFPLVKNFQLVVGVHQASVLSPLLFIIVLKALLSKFSTSSVPWELLYAEDLAVIGESLTECLEKVKTWKN